MEKTITKIICTIGPASDKLDVMRQMADAGMNVARLNFSHGNFDEHQKRFDNIKKLNQTGYNIKILQDLEGFRIRLGELPDNGTALVEKGQKICLANKKDFKRENINIIPFDYLGDLSIIDSGLDIYIDDGNILLKSLSAGVDFVNTEVVIPGVLKSRKGVNVPALKLDFDFLTEKDKKDICFGIENNVDFIAQSFVRNKNDMVCLKEYIDNKNFKCKTIAKIENREGIDNVESILAVADGVMVARGDMGVSIPIYEVPVMQKKIIKLCNNLKKIDITATQMLESMTFNFRPTRAEVSDVANAVIDGSDYVMLSGETAVGKYPVNTVRMMKKIIDFTLHNYSL
ncbi:MAG: pyruvate kinase [Bacteroidetes bacterium]|nr:pyruvate kinase [Bacteroidota bacterium]